MSTSNTNNNSGDAKPPIWFWVISALALVWNLMGVAAFFGMMMMSPEMATEAYGQGFSDIFSTKPAWATGAFAIAVFAGALGCIGLLLRKKWAHGLFILSLAGVIVHNIWGILAGTLSVIGPFDKVMTIAVVLVGALLIWYAGKRIADGTLS